MNKNKYPIITISGVVISKKRRYKIRKIGGHHSIYLDIKKSILDEIIKTMQRQWGLPTITTAVQIKFSFYVPAYPLNQKVDHDNAKQLYLDLLQSDKWKVHQRGENKGLKYLSFEGAGIISDDKIVQSTDGTRFIFMCFSCKWGFTGERRQFTRKKIKMGCPGMKSCPDQRIEIEITDMILGKDGIYYNKDRI
jgi:hypothetical protein